MGRRTLAPVRVFWCSTCGMENEDQVCTGTKWHINRVKEDVGYRVGNHRGDYSYYSTLEAAMKDRRVR